MSEMFAQQAAGRDTLAPSLPVMAPLVDRRRETEGIVSLLFELPRAAGPSFRPEGNVPGQFVMIWLPGMNEKPFVISHLSKKCFGITVMIRGDFSRRLADLKVGGAAGFRGPFGRGFSRYGEYESERIVILGGGCGMAPLALLMQKLPDATVVQGAASAADLLFLDRFPRQVVFTEDGSAGIKGLPTDWLKGNLSARFDMIYTCGPEPMMKAALDLCRAGAVSCQAALERYMKCGIGVCGQCECDGRLICRDGPVFSDTELVLMPSFGNVRRDAAGRRIAVAPEAGLQRPNRLCGR